MRLLRKLLALACCFTFGISHAGCTLLFLKLVPCVSLSLSVIGRCTELVFRLFKLFSLLCIGILSNYNGFMSAVFNERFNKD